MSIWSGLGSAALALVVVSVSSATPPTAAVSAVCASVDPFPNGTILLHAIRVYTNVRGQSAFETLELHGESKAYFRPGELFSHTVLGATKKVQLVTGPPAVTMPQHASLGKEMFLTIQGSSVVTLPNGDERAVTPGTLVIFDDEGSKIGHGGRTGPCGYVAVNIVPGDAAPVSEAGKAPPP